MLSDLKNVDDDFIKETDMKDLCHLLEVGGGEIIVGRAGGREVGGGGRGKGEGGGG